MNNFDRDSLVLLEELSSLETELHKDETRHDRQRMETLLHPDFIEFGRSGTRYTRAEILREFGPGRFTSLSMIIRCAGGKRRKLGC